MTQSKKLGVYLSGGGARSVCFFGVMQAWRDNDIRIDCLGAHSGAALVLSHQVECADDTQFLASIKQFRFSRFASWNPLRNNGLISISKLETYLRQISQDKKIETLEVETFIVCTNFTDFNHPKKIIFDTGFLGTASLISILIPPLLPFYRDGQKRILGDGGFISLYSAHELRKRGCEVTIGMYPNALEHTKVPRFAQDYGRLIKSLNSIRNESELLEEPIDLEIKNFECSVGLTDFERAQEAYDAGYKKGLETLKQLKQLLE